MGILVTGDAIGSSRVAVINNTVYVNDDRGIFFSGTVIGSPGGLVLNNAVEANLGNNATGIQVNPSSLPGYVSAGNVSVDRFPTGTPVDATDQRVAMLLAERPEWSRTPSSAGVGFADDDFHLNQKAAGQSDDSPALDAGAVSAAAVSLAEASTRTDGRPDRGTVDAGYHYGNDGHDAHTAIDRVALRSGVRRRRRWQRRQQWRDPGDGAALADGRPLALRVPAIGLCSRAGNLP